MMMRLIWAFSVLCFALPAGAQDAPRAGAVRAPYELTRSLQALQDQVALGNTAAHEAQRKLLQHTGEQFLAADPEVWSDLRNARAAIVFVLSGGSPATYAELRKQGRLAGLQQGLVDGALAYAEGREEDARASLNDVDPKGLPPSLGGNVALVLATLALKENPQAAIPLLETARLLMPGTLVEEAALRREVFAAGEIGNLKLFQSLALQYLRRFGGSVYASAFRGQLTSFLTGGAVARDPARLAALEDLVSELGDEEQRAVRLSLARSAIAAGDLPTARAASGKALALAAEGSADHARARLYAAAAEIVSGQVGSATAALESVDPAALAADDARLRETALAVANEMRRRPEGVPSPEDADAPTVEAEVVPLQTATMLRAEQALSAADALLGRSAE